MKWLNKRKPVFAKKNPVFVPTAKWQENAPAFLKPGNMETYSPPRDWGKACAIQNLRAGVRLTDAQKARFPDLARVEAELLKVKKGVKA